MKTALIILADGFEEIEAFTVIDILRRAGVKVHIAGLDGLNVEGAHGIKVLADIELAEAPLDGDAIILPGGMPGSERLADERVGDLVRAYHAGGKLVAAICAAPALALSPTGVLEGRSATCYPGFEESFPQTTSAMSQPVVVDGNIITSRGPGTAHKFALTLVERLVDARTASELRSGMLWDL